MMVTGKTYNSAATESFKTFLFSRVIL